jgi:hypothetical protein
MSYELSEFEKQHVAIVTQAGSRSPGAHPRLLARARTVAEARRQEVLGHLAVAISGLDRICQAAQELTGWADQLRSFRARLECVDIDSKEDAVLMEKTTTLSMHKIEASLNAFAEAIGNRPVDEKNTNQ